MSKADAEALKAELRRSRGQEETTVNPKEEYSACKRKAFVQPKTRATKKFTTPNVLDFRVRYQNLENYIDTFTSEDLLLFFVEIASQSDVEYVTMNKMKDKGVFNNLLKKKSQREICAAIEFIFQSEQDYLDKRIVQPSVLVSGYSHKIFQDLLLWIDGEYLPNRNKVDKFKQTAILTKESKSKVDSIY